MLIDFSYSDFLSCHIICPSFKTEQLQLTRVGFGGSHSCPLALYIVRLNIFNTALKHFQITASLHISLAQFFPILDSPGNVAPRCHSGWIVSDSKTTDKCFTFSNGPQGSDSPLQCSQPLLGNSNTDVGNEDGNPFGNGNSIVNRGISWCCPPPDQKLCSARFRWSEEGDTNNCYTLTGHCCC